jgi:hypothetical protein
MIVPAYFCEEGISTELFGDEDFDANTTIWLFWSFGSIFLFLSKLS